MYLTDKAIKGTKPKSQVYRLADGKGLYLEVTPQGSKLWRYRYRFNDKQKTLALGVYGEVSLADARDKHQEARKLVAAGIDPMIARKQEKAQRSNEFGKVAKEWWYNKKDGWSEDHGRIIWNRLAKNVLPWLENRPIHEITTGELLGVLRKMESRGAVETAHRVGQVCNQLFIYAIACGYLESNPASSISKALKERKVKNMPAITEPKEITELLRAIDGLGGTYTVKCAMRFLPLVFVRPGELRTAEWVNISLDDALWIIPAAKMKMSRDHIVPLSKQAVEILRELQPLTGGGKYVFPSVRTKARPMSENTLNVALRRLGYSKDDMVAHGFRTMASTRLHEMGWKSEIIEFQLAHADKNKIRGVYNRAEYLEERKRMMQGWADYLDALKNEEKVIPFRRSGEP